MDGEVGHIGLALYVVARRGMASISSWEGVRACDIRSPIWTVADDATDDATDESRRCPGPLPPKIAGGGARSLMSYTESISCLTFGWVAGTVVRLAGSVGKSEYDCFRAWPCVREVDCEDNSAIGSGIVGMLQICSTAFDASALYLAGDLHGGLLIDSILIIRPFSGPPIWLAGLSARLSNSAVGVIGPKTGSTR
jgi:hypothetical protein